MLKLIVDNPDPGDPKNQDGFVSWEKSILEDGSEWYKVWTHAEGNIPCPSFDLLFKTLQKRLERYPETRFGHTPIVNKKKEMKAEISIQFPGPLSKNRLTARIRLFKSCLRTAKILLNPMDCPLTIVK